MILKSKQTKKCILAAVLIAISSMQFAAAQTQHWRTAAREKSQRLASSAQNQLVLSNADAAIPLLQEGTRADPTDPLPFLLLGMALNMKGRYQEALDALKQSYALDSKARETYLTVGFSHYLSHRYEQAVAVWQKVLQANPDVVPIYTNIGFGLLRDGKTEEAENSLRECAKRSTYSGASYRGLMLLHYLNGNFPIARSAAQQAGPAGGKQAHLVLAEIDFLEGNAKLAAKQLASLPKPTKKARPSFDMVSLGYLPQHDFHFDPFSADYYDNESLIEARFVDLPKRDSRRAQLAKKGKSDSALSDVRTALATAPNDPYLNFQSGAIRLAAGDFPSASQDFAKVIGRAPDWHLAKLYLALSRFREGKVTDAKTALEGFERACPGRQLAPLFAMIKNADAQPGQAAAEQKDEQFTLPDDAKNRPPSKGDAGF
ncbi:MAG: hypothetical protein C0507_22350 [Cyanobacteria bacterium PR.3.49]|jgi:tetratricopeptide (TPR) repeat protein|nr:hypothetical protein [Cyanobacteria bacterium PR.3.49]